ncbi:Photosystem II protein Y [Stanieria cyanosphaera PCC 7437]|uniref:Photosystem II reaction center protein Y n=1 Tax=Stanieria cyanosphaera (strain ATCC 29371 / PCC 7437) TaxID=111780 RepID=K9XRZ7_STAC7|nr:photosystem II protein Y [Stanieria cyanosphaera]AFZ34447.1 Photosystem II protein Y [Stanieria cyanosphaera PCC 7437]
MDWRLIIVLAPLIVAGSWALYNVGTIALRQAQQFIGKNS